jgi:rhamnose transport system ATP-binding protein
MEDEPKSHSDVVPILRLGSVRKSFAGVHALRDVSFDVFGGEVHALVGENGAGKSTLIKVLAGVHQPDAGQIFVDGAAKGIGSPAAAQDFGIAVIYQEPTLFPDLTVAENVLMRRQPVGRLGRIQWATLFADVQKIFDSLGVQIDVHAKVRGLSIADQQMVEVAKALSMKARVLIMDEPTAALTPSEVRDLFAIVERLRSSGAAIIFISHRLEEVLAIADRITVLRDGQQVATMLRAGVTVETLVRDMVGRTLSTLFERVASTIGEPCLEIKGLSRGRIFQDIDLEVRHGEIVGLAGLVGAGRSEVARAIFGIDQPDSGQILLNGKVVKVRSPRHALTLGLAYVPEDRGAHGLVAPMSIQHNVTLTILRQVCAGGWTRDREEQSVTRDYATRLQIRMAGPKQKVRELSGGNQQKVVLAKWLATQPKVLILDEPTRGIDVGAKAEVHRLMGELAAQGLAILMISSELPEVLAMSDRILVMHGGRIAGRFTREEATQERVMVAAAGQGMAGKAAS